MTEPETFANIETKECGTCAFFLRRREESGMGHCRNLRNVYEGFSEHASRADPDAEAYPLVTDLNVCSLWEVIY